MSVLSIKVPIRKSLETYLMILVHISCTSVHEFLSNFKTFELRKIKNLLSSYLQLVITNRGIERKTPKHNASQALLYPFGSLSKAVEARRNQ